MGYPVRWEENFAAPLQEETNILQTTETLAIDPAIRTGRAVLTAVCAAAFLFLMAAGIFSVLQREQQPPSLSLDITPSSKMALASVTANRRVGFVVVTGNVSNRSANTLHHIEAVVELLDSQQRTLKMESGLIDLDPTPSGRTSAFQVELMDDPRATKYHIHFRQLMGAPLD